MQKNILFLLHNSNLNNGATRSLVDIIENLVKHKDIKIVVAYPNETGTAIDYLNNLGIKTISIRYGTWEYPMNINCFSKVKFISKSIIRQITGLFNLNKFKKIIKDDNINLIYSNTIVNYMGCILKRKYNIKHVWHIREFGVEDHGFGIMGGYSKLYAYLNKYTDAIIFISNSVCKKFICNIDDKKKAHILYNDISKNFICKKDKFNFKSVLNICIIGTIQPGKGQLEVIQAVEILKKRGITVELHIAGHRVGWYYQYLEEYVTTNDLNDCVIFDGFIANVNKYRQHMDVGVVASFSEAFGRVTIEGMLSQLLMIGADAAGTSELIKSGSNGFLYPLHDVESLAKLILEINNDRKKMKKVALAGYEYALTFTNGSTEKEIYNIINSL